MEIVLSAVAAGVIGAAGRSVIARLPEPEEPADDKVAYARIAEPVWLVGPDNRVLPYHPTPSIHFRHGGRANVAWCDDFDTAYQGFERLRRARNRIDMLKTEIHDYYSRHRVNRNFIELRHLIVVAELIVDAAMKRDKSVGLHYNIDCPA